MDADRRRAGCAALAHLRQLLALLDWSAERMPGPERAAAPGFEAWRERQRQGEEREKQQAAQLGRDGPA